VRSSARSRPRAGRLLRSLVCFGANSSSADHSPTTGYLGWPLFVPAECRRCSRGSSARPASKSFRSTSFVLAPISFQPRRSSTEAGRSQQRSVRACRFLASRPQFARANGSWSTVACSTIFPSTRWPWRAKGRRCGRRLGPRSARPQKTLSPGARSATSNARRDARALSDARQPT
jgi:hypothetical protein